MTNEQITSDIQRYRESAESWGATAVRALVEGDEGAARTATRQAAKYARVAMQLENGESWSDPLCELLAVEASSTSSAK